MTENTSRFKINEPTVVHENIDGETVILNLDTGNYYSVVEVGAYIWECLVEGTPANEILPLIQANYECPPGGEAETVHSFLEELQQEGLISPINEEATTPETARNSRVKIKTGENKAPFNAPVLNKYTDMQDLLLLDPIHEVDAEGWPSTSPEK